MLVEPPVRPYRLPDRELMAVADKEDKYGTAVFARVVDLEKLSEILVFKQYYNYKKLLMNTSQFPMLGKHKYCKKSDWPGITTPMPLKAMS
jgi:hypothetical protein